MKKQRQNLQNALDSGRMVRVITSTDRDNQYFDAFVVGMSKAFSLFHVLNSDLMCLNGYTALPVREVKSVRTLDKFDRFEERALALKKITPLEQPDIFLADFPGLLSSVNSHFSLVTVHRERREPDTCYIGRVAQMRKQSVALREIDPGACWRTEIRKYRFKDITRVDFGGGYEAALWAVAEAKRLEQPR